MRTTPALILLLTLCAAPAWAAADPERQAYVRELEAALERLDRAPPVGVPQARNDALQSAVAGVLSSSVARRRAHAWVWLEQLLVEHRQGDAQRQALLETQLRERLAGLRGIALEALEPAPQGVYPQPPALALNKLLLRPQFRHADSGPELFPALAERLKYYFQRFLRAPTERAFLVSRLVMALLVIGLCALLLALVLRRHARARRLAVAAGGASALGDELGGPWPSTGDGALEALARRGRAWTRELERVLGLAADPSRTLAEALGAAAARGLARPSWPALLSDYQRLRYGAGSEAQRRDLCARLEREVRLRGFAAGASAARDRRTPTPSPGGGRTEGRA